MVPEDASTRLWRRRPVLADVIIASWLLLTDLVLAPRLIGDAPRSGTQAALTALTLAVIPLRNRRPVLTLTLATAGTAVVMLLRGIETFASAAPLLALYTVALRTDRRTTVLAWAATAAIATVASALGSPSDIALREALPVLPYTAAVAAVGDGLRNRRAYLAAVEERAVRAERSREEEARRRVAEERVRIARELHDVVAHHIAVVGVQAGVAQHLLATAPAAASDALGNVRRSAAAVLEELGDILSVLREPGEPVRPDAPAPGLARLDSLVASFAAAGLGVDWSLHGQPRQLVPTVDLVAYRVLEESLTNALKHGTGTAHVSVDYRPTSVRLRVVNNTSAEAVVAAHGRTPPEPASPVGTGHGLLGMSERAAAVGGTLRAAAGTGDTFVVAAELPIRDVVTP